MSSLTNICLDKIIKKRYRCISNQGYSNTDVMKKGDKKDMATILISEIMDKYGLNEIQFIFNFKSNIIDIISSIYEVIKMDIRTIKFGKELVTVSGKDYEGDFGYDIKFRGIGYYPSKGRPNLLDKLEVNTDHIKKYLINF